LDSIAGTANKETPMPTPADEKQAGKVEPTPEGPPSARGTGFFGSIFKMVGVQ